MPTRNVNLSDQQATFIRQSIKAGRYRNASEVVRAGLRLLKQRDKEDRLKLDTLRRLATDAFAAIDRGEYVTVAPGQLDEFMRRASAKARKAAKA
jgi:antitoxin ParD1/3/4